MDKMYTAAQESLNLHYAGSPFSDHILNIVM